MWIILRWRLDGTQNKMSSSSDGRNDLLAKTLRKTPKNGSIQGTGKFVTPFLYFDTSRSCDPMEKDRLKLEDWLVKHNAKIEELRKEIRRKPRHSDINSPNTPMKGDYMHDGDLETNVEATVVYEQKILHKLFCSTLW